MTFAQGSTGELLLLNSAAFHGEITGFTGTGTGAPATSDKIDLRDINFNSVNFSKTYVNNVLTVTDGTHTANIQMVGSYTLANFHFAADGSGGTLVTDPPAPSDQNGASSREVAANTTTIPLAVSGDMQRPSSAMPDKELKLDVFTADKINQGLREAHSTIDLSPAQTSYEHRRPDFGA